MDDRKVWSVKNYSFKNVHVSLKEYIFNSAILMHACDVIWVVVKC